MQELDWSLLRHVLAAARAGTLAGAAKQLRVNETTVARRLFRAEAVLGARLLERRDGRLHPTEAGAVLLGHAERIEREVDAVREAVAGADRIATGTVRLTAVPVLINRILIPALPPFLQSHPGLTLELIAEPRNLSLTRREADLALRLARPEHGLGTLVRRIGRLVYRIYGPSGRCWDDLPWITYSEEMAALPQARWIREQHRRPAVTPLLVNDAEAILQAIAAGLGKSLLPSAIAENHQGVAVEPSTPPVLSREVWLLLHPDLRDLARIRAVVEWLAATLHPDAVGTKGNERLDSARRVLL
jgi:DNA-binding transcriptional LysR family regulator